MKVLVKQLLTFVPEIPADPNELVDILIELGIEATVVGKDVLDLAITPNRGDAMSALGLARDLQVWLHRDDSTLPNPLIVSETGLLDRLPPEKSSVATIEAPKLVDAYEAVVFEHVTVQASPAWLAKAVTALGWRSINNIVDLTNYLMDVYGQPLHAFDLDAVLGGTVTLRQSTAGEQLTTLDGVEHQLPAGLLVIQDRDSLIDLVGVMGGANSQIHPRTTRVLLQAAALDTKVIRQATNATGLRTQAAIRYERGTDPLIARPVLNEAIRLLKRTEFGRAKPVGQLSQSSRRPATRSIMVVPARVNGLLGFKVPDGRQIRLLELLGCLVRRLPTGLAVRPPSWRHDLSIWQDVAEEIARLSGLNQQLPAKQLPKLKVPHERSQIEWSEALKDRLVELGLSEVLTYSFTSSALLKVLELPVVGELANPLNPTLRYLRPSLVPNLVAAVAANQSFDPMLLFEIGHTFTKTSEEGRLAVALVGQTLSTDGWLVRLADALGIDSLALRSAATVFELTDGQRAALKLRKQRATFVEFRLDDLALARRIPVQFAQPTATVVYRPVSRFPAVSRDLALLVPLTVSSSAIRSFVLAFDQWVESVTLFDEFQSAKLGSDVKSLAFHIRYADHSRTLTEAEVTSLHDRLVAAIERTFAGRAR